MFTKPKSKTKKCEKKRNNLNFQLDLYLLFKCKSVATYIFLYNVTGQLQKKSVKI